MNRFVRKLLCSTAMILPFGGNAAESISVEAKAEYETWASGLGGQSNAPLAGLGVGYYKNDYFFGTGFVTGNYNISGTSDTVTRADLDVVAGKKLNGEWSAFVGYRLNLMAFSDKDDGTSFDETTHGLGAGLMLSQVLNKGWVGFATFAISGLTTETKYKDSSIGDDSGQGVSVNTEAGAIFRINNISDVAMRVKYQTSRLSYESAEWPHSYFRLGASFSRRF